MLVVDVGWGDCGGDCENVNISGRTLSLLSSFSLVNWLFGEHWEVPLSGLSDAAVTDIICGLLLHRKYAPMNQMTKERNNGVVHPPDYNSDQQKERE